MFARSPRWVEPVILAGLVVGGVAQSSAPLPLALALGAVTIGVGVALAHSADPHRRPVASGSQVLAITAVAIVATSALCSGSAANVGWFAVCILAGWSAFTAGARVGIAVTVLACASFTVQWLFVDSDDGWGAWYAGTVLSTLVCLLVRREADLVVRLRAAQAGVADRAREEERQRIARELHDVIGHALTVSLLHVSSARLSLDDDPAEARAALAEAERLGRHSLTEVRQAVGLLRGLDREGRVPLPGLADIDELVAGVQRVGAGVAYECVGDVTCAGATIGLTAYRIVQEALTNAVRHGDAGTTHVRVDVSTERTVVTVDSSGDAVPEIGNGAGIQLMRDRAASVGGTVDVGPTATGWRVHAVLPAVPSDGVRTRGVAARIDP